MTRASAIKVASKIGFALVLLLTLVALASVVSRFIFTWRVLTGEASAIDTADEFDFNQRYAASPRLTMIHVVAGFFFMVTGPTQFVPRIRNRWLRYHRVMGRVYVIASLFSVASALAFVPLLPVFGTFTAKAGTTFAGLFFLVATVQGYLNGHRRRLRQHREWMIRSYATGLAIATFRVFLPLLMMPPLLLPLPEAWDTVVWLGFAVNILVAEVWINVTRPTAPGATPSPLPGLEAVLAKK